MRLGRTTLANTDRKLIDFLAEGRGFGVYAIVRAFYANSKQPQKKAATFTKRLRRLQRLGYVRVAEGVWFTTDKGRDEAGHKERAKPFELRLTPARSGKDE